MVGNNFM